MIKIENIVIPAARLKATNPLPDIKNNTYIHAGFETTDRITEEEKTYLGYGMIDTILPYQMQDQYDRDVHPRTFRAVVVENEYLRAEFLPELGGRLWSLYDKTLSRELLYKNTVFQPANLALRNAWFSGGVEFNVGIKGHTPLTCSPMFCEIAETDQGEILSLYEYERIRGVVYTVSAWLPEKSRVLYLRCRIENLENREKPMYWWSNIAVPETKNTRVIVPAKEAFLCYYQEDHYLLDKIKLPEALQTDVTYPVNLKNSHDFFYKIPEKDDKWIAAAQKDGIGLLQCSTDFLKGRKMFLWGQNPGGRNWNRFLSDRKTAYIEIQAGLAYTQLEHIPMPANSEWEWIEAYTALQGNPDKLFGSFESAIGEVSRCLTERVGNPKKLSFPAESSVRSRQILAEGSGWGAVEEILRDKKISRYHTFSFVKDESNCWRELLETNRLPAPPLNTLPESYVIGDLWEKELIQLPQKNWFSMLHLGIILYAKGDLKEAKRAWETSLNFAENAWAHRNLGMMELNEFHHYEAGLDHLLRAIEIKRDCRSLYVECGAWLTANGEDEHWLSVFASMPEYLKEDGRLRLYRAIALCHLQRFSEAAEIVNERFEMVDIKEGELSVSAIWKDLYRKLYRQETGIDSPEEADEKYPLPANLDFRMHI